MPKPDISFFGRDLLSYTLNVEVEELDQRIAEIASHPRYKSALDVLSACAVSVRRSRQSLASFSELDSKNLEFLSLENGESPFNHVRYLLGGDIPPLVGEDALERLLSKLCIHNFPILLSPHAKGRFTGHSLVGSFIREPFASELHNALAQCRIFGQFFGMDANSVAESAPANPGFYSSSMGSAGNADPNLLPFSLMTSGALWASTEPGFSIASFTEKTIEAKRLLARALAGETIMVPRISIYEGVDVVRPISLAGDEGRIIPVNHHFKKVLDKLLGTDEFTQPRRRHCAIIRTVQHEIKEGVTHGNPDYDLMKRQPDFSDGENSLSIISTLCQSDISVISPRFTNCINLDFISTHPNISGIKYYDEARESKTLDEDDCIELERIAPIYLENRTESTAIAERQLISAIQRNNPVDKLIDSIIGLENLFGGQPQISVSISVCTSKLLSKEKSDLKIIFSEVKKLYNYRSNIVHGNVEKDLEKIRKSADRATFYLRNCIKTLYASHPQLLPLSGKDRSEKILLDLY
jgi:hypothetical protein